MKNVCLLIMSVLLSTMLFYGQHIAAAIPIQTDEGVHKSSQRRISLLEAWIAPQSAAEVAEIWARSVQLRNGAVQFSVLSPKLQEQTKQSYEDLNWVTGVSSPWVENYIVIGINSEGNGQSIFEIEFEMVTSAGEAGKVTVELVVQQKNSKWLITSIKVVKDTENLGQIILPSDNPIEP